MWRGQQVGPVEGAGRKAGEEDRVKAPCVWVGWGHFREAGGATEDAGCALGWGCAAPAATPLGKPTAELRVNSSWRKMCYCLIRIAAGAWALAGTMAVLELPGWALQDGAGAQSKSLSTSRGPGGREARTHVLAKSRMKFP